MPAAIGVNPAVKYFRIKHVDRRFFFNLKLL